MSIAAQIRELEAQIGILGYGQPKPGSRPPDLG